MASHGITWLSHSGLPNMGGLVLYMVTCIYTFCADQGSLESISKDFPCVTYCKQTTRFPCTTTFLPTLSYHFLFLSDHFQPRVISSYLA
jgi:UDP-N-acetylmuramyl pentapeptide phosphotransferase/UDP-N-acetylglucosamine-1-phosphate transferase